MTQRFTTLPAAGFRSAASDALVRKASAYALARRPWPQQVLLSALGAALFMLVAGWVGAVWLTAYAGWGDGVVVNKLQAVTLPGLFVRYDSWYYLQIARDGYRPDGSERAFFPLYPLLVRWLSLLVGLPLLWSGFLISLGSFVGSAFFLYQWAYANHGARVARLTTLIFCLFPMSFFHLAFYAEPLLLLTSAAFFYFAQRGRFMAAGLAICLAGATRGTAFLLAIPYLLEFASQYRANFQMCPPVDTLGRASYTSVNWRRWTDFVLGGLLAPIGFLAYYQYRGFHVEGGWGTRYAWPWTVLQDGLSAALFGTNIDADWFSRALVWQDLIYAVGALIVGLWVFRKMRMSASLFLLISLLFMWTLHGPDGYAFWSTPRRVALLLPIYPALALLLMRLPQRVQQVLLVSSAILLALTAAWFASGRWVA